MDKKYKKDRKYAEDESDFDEEAIEAHEDRTKEKEIEKAEKKFAKENEKLEAEGEKPQNVSVLEERIQDIEEEYERVKKERGTGKATLKRERPAEKIEEAITKLDVKIVTAKLQMADREAGKEIALGTRYVSANPFSSCLADNACSVIVKSIIWTLGMLIHLHVR
jgi:DNA topoisomerase-1